MAKWNELMSRSRKWLPIKEAIVKTSRNSVKNALIHFDRVHKARKKAAKKEAAKAE